MTEEQFKKLEKFDRILIAAANRKYFKYPDKETKSELGEVYSEITGRKTSFSSGCGSCSGIRPIERLGKWYKEYKEKHINE